MKRIFLTTYFIIVCSFLGLAQNWFLSLTGRVEQNGVDLEGASVTLMNGAKQISQIITEDDGEFGFQVPPDGNFTIIVTKKGLCSKNFQVSTKFVPSQSKGVSRFDIPGIILFEQNPEVDYSILNQPIVKIKYDTIKNIFDYDEEYFTKSLAALEKLRQLEKEAIDRQKSINTNYLSFIKSGDKAFQKKDWSSAKQFYQQATELKKAESYPKSQLILVDNNIKTQNELVAKLASEKAIADKLASEKLASEKALAEKLAAEKAIADKLAAEKLAAKIASEKLASEKALAEKLASEKAIADKQAAEKLAAKIASEKLASEKALAEKLASEKAIADKLAAEKLAAKIASEKLATEKALAEKLASEKAIADKLAAEKLAAKIASEKLASEKALADKLASDKASAEKLAAEKNKSTNTIAPVLGFDKYKDAISNGDNYFKTKRYLDAKKAYQEALINKTNDTYATNKLIEIEKILNSDLANLAELNPKMKALMAKYPLGVTEETIEGPGVTVIQRVVVTKYSANVYQKKTFSWGGITFLRDATPITEPIFEQETKP
jgi:hypothetical protein